MIYFDNAATTKPFASALERASKYNAESFFNPSALYHGGVENKKAIKLAKEKILSYISADDRELIFTSCGTESDNQAILCNHTRGDALTTLGEHAAVFNSFSELKKRGRTVHFAPINKDGSVNVPALISIVKENPKIDFVSVVHVCNETGAINDINAIAKEIKSVNKNIVFHSDGVQAFGKLPYKIGECVDLYSVSAHKINALKGTGALFKKKTVAVDPLIIGGGQEDDLRSGTENIFGINVFRFAAEEHFSALNANFENALKIKNTIINGLDRDIFTVISGENASPFILSLSANKLKGEVIMHALEEDGIIVGNGSACSSKSKYSRILKECGYNSDVLEGVIRISSFSENSVKDAEILTDKLNETARKLKKVMYNG